MKLWNNLLITVLAGLLIMGCSSPVYVQKDDTVNLNNYHTYMWVDTRANENDQSTRATAYVDMNVKNAVNAELNKLGWREVSDNPDAFVSYDILVERSTEQRSDPVYSRPVSRVYYNPFSRRWGTIYYPSQFMGYDTYTVPVKEGTVTVTITDSRTDKVVWQGWTTETLNYARITDKEINKSVKNIFNKFASSS
ncbi:MAG TPA: DUF4136 domain-containing protein [Chitinophagaceae bacterium]|nr:DUF4136 domain-containing protein [Chitinophagaceae bacterium]